MREMWAVRARDRIATTVGLRRWYNFTNRDKRAQITKLINYDDLDWQVLQKSRVGRVSRELEFYC